MSAPGGPWTRHGHDIPGVTVAGSQPPAIARCGGPALCRLCREDVAQARGEKPAAPARPTPEQLDDALASADIAVGPSMPALAAEVRALRAELEAVAAFEPLVEARRYIAALQVERDEARAALAARTPQPAEHAAVGRCGHPLTMFGRTSLCALSADHRGWHRDGPTEWSDGSPHPDSAAAPGWCCTVGAQAYPGPCPGHGEQEPVAAPLPAVPDGEDAQHHPLTATALREAEQRWQNLPLDEKDRWAAEHDDPRCAFIAAALSTAATRPTGEGR